MSSSALRRSSMPSSDPYLLSTTNSSNIYVGNNHYSLRPVAAGPAGKQQDANRAAVLAWFLQNGYLLDFSTLNARAQGFYHCCLLCEGSIQVTRGPACK
jgi:hypothetical protein